jgi:hypothetical protein
MTEREVARLKKALSYIIAHTIKLLQSAPAESGSDVRPDSTGAPVAESVLRD